MSARVYDILTALKARLEQLPYPVYIGRELRDDETDLLPMVSVFFSESGEKSNEKNLNDMAKSLQSQELNLVVECHKHVSRDHPVLDLEAMHTEVKAALFNCHSPRIAKGKIVQLKRRRSIPPPQGSDIGTLIIEVIIPFHEEY